MPPRISALMDDELPVEEMDVVINSLPEEARARMQWDVYHLIGDALRRDDDLRVDVVGRVMSSIDEEPMVRALPHSRSSGLVRQGLALAASVAGVAVLGALVWTGRGIRSSMPEESFSRRQTATAITLTAADSLGVANMQEYLLAHQAHAPSGPMQGAQYMRTFGITRVGMNR